jgi:hypothetical protein
MDRGVVLYRKMLREQIERAQSGQDPVGIARDPALDVMIRFDLSTGQARVAREARPAETERRWYESDSKAEV